MDFKTLQQQEKLINKSEMDFKTLMDEGIDIN